MPLSSVSEFIRDDNIEGLVQLVDQRIIFVNDLVKLIFIVCRDDMKWDMLVELSSRYPFINIFRLVGFAIESNEASYCVKFIDTCAEFQKKTLLDGAYWFARISSRPAIADLLLQKGADLYSDVLDGEVIEVTRSRLQGAGHMAGNLAFEEDSERDMSGFIEDVFEGGEEDLPVLTPPIAAQ